MSEPHPGPPVRAFIDRARSIADQAERDWSSPPTHRVDECELRKHYRPLAEQESLSTGLERLADAALVELSGGGWDGRNAEERTQALLLACRQVLGWIPTHYRVKNFSPAGMQAGQEADRQQQAVLLNGVRQAALALQRAGRAAAARQAGPAAPPAAQTPVAPANSISEFRNYLRQVRASFELAGMAGARRRPAQWETLATELWAEWRERLPENCPPPPPHRPPVWSRAEVEAAIDILIGALNALQPAPPPAAAAAAPSTPPVAAEETPAEGAAPPASAAGGPDQPWACPRCNGHSVAEGHDDWLTCRECGFQYTRQTQRVLIVTGPHGEPIPLPVESVQGTTEAGKGHVIELHGTLPPSRERDLWAVSEAVGQSPRAAGGVLLPAVRAAGGQPALNREDRPRLTPLVSQIIQESAQGFQPALVPLPGDARGDARPAERIAELVRLLHATVHAVRPALVNAAGYTVKEAAELTRQLVNAAGRVLLDGPAREARSLSEDFAEYEARSISLANTIDDALNTAEAAQRATPAEAAASGPAGEPPPNGPASAATTPHAPPDADLPVPTIPHEAYASSSALRSAAMAEKDRWHARRDQAHRALRKWREDQWDRPQKTAEGLLEDVDCHWSKWWCDTLFATATFPTPCAASEIRQWCDLQYSVLALMQHARHLCGWWQLKEPLPEELGEEGLDLDIPAGPGRDLSLGEAAAPVLCFLADREPDSRPEWEAAIARLQRIRPKEPDETLDTEAVAQLVEKLWHALRRVGDPPPEPPAGATFAAARAALDLAKGWRGKEATSDHYVDLDQTAAVVHRSKSTLEKLKRRKKNPLPDPDVQGGGGKKDEWLWSRVRPWLETEFKKHFAETLPRKL